MTLTPVAAACMYLCRSRPHRATVAGLIARALPRGDRGI